MLQESLSNSLGRYPGVVAAYLFGSRNEGRAHRESDVDVGVLLDRAAYPKPAERFEARVRLATLLEHELAPLHPDIVILNDAPPTLAARIVTTGTLLFCGSAELEHAFRRDIQLRAADLQPFLRRMRALKLQAVLDE